MAGFGFGFGSRQSAGPMPKPATALGGTIPVGTPLYIVGDSLSYAERDSFSSGYISWLIGESMAIHLSRHH